MREWPLEICIAVDDCITSVGVVPEVDNVSGGVVEGGVTANVATPVVGVSGGRLFSSLSLLLSSRRLVLLACSRLLLPEC